MTPRFPRQITEKEWIEDFRDFVSSNEVEVPETLSKRVLQYVHRALHPSPTLIFAKLLGIHAVVGTLSLALCDQFGMSPFNSGISLSEYFMRFGHSACMFLCGFLFLSLTVLFVALLFRPEEFKAFKRNVWLQVPSLAFLSIAVFFGLGTGMVFSIAVLWFVGAVLGGVLSVFAAQRFAYA